MTRHTGHNLSRSAASSEGNLHAPSVPLTTLSTAQRPSSSQHEDLSDEDDLEFADSEMPHPSQPRTAAFSSHQPLLHEDKNDNLNGNHHVPVRPALGTRTSTFSSRTPRYPQPEDSTKQRYIYAALCLMVALVSFVVQTETAVYIQHELKWNKAYCMLWLTHGSWSLLWPIQLVFLRIFKRKLSWAAFWRRHKSLLKTTAQMVQHQDLKLSASTSVASPLLYMLKTTAFVTTFLTFAGASWYVAVDLTSPSDLTAIYNCSAFFAYVFSILLLNDKVRMDKMFSVGLAIVGVLVVAYGDKEDTHPKSPGHSGGSTNPTPDSPPDNRLLGNLVIGIGSVLYGLYEVLYKKYACPPEGTSPQRGMIFANAFGSMIGVFTLTVLWIPLPILHFTGLEVFELPTGKAAWMLSISTLSNAIFSGSFLVLMSLTSPVLSSVAALLTIFLVAIVDWLLTGKALSVAAITGGLFIIVAFVLLSWATYREMQEHAKKREEDENHAFDDEDFDGDMVVDGREDYDEDEDEDENAKAGSNRMRHRDS